MSKAVIRHADSKEAEALFEIEQACFEKPWSVDAFERTLANTSARIYVAELDGTACGYVSCFMLPPYECQIGNVAVLPEYRGRGYAKALLAELFKEAEELSCEEITLEVRVSNAPAIALYTGLGFTENGRRKNYYDGREDAILMHRI